MDSEAHKNKAKAKGHKFEAQVTVNYSNGLEEIMLPITAKNLGGLGRKIEGVLKSSATDGSIKTTSLLITVVPINDGTLD